MRDSKSTEELRRLLIGLAETYANFASPNNHYEFNRGSREFKAVEQAVLDVEAMTAKRVEEARIDELETIRFLLNNSHHDAPIGTPNDYCDRVINDRIEILATLNTLTKEEK